MDRTIIGRAIPLVGIMAHTHARTLYGVVEHLLERIQTTFLSQFRVLIIRPMVTSYPFDLDILPIEIYELDWETSIHSSSDKPVAQYCLSITL
jgi:hypothetical protein